MQTFLIYFIGVLAAYAVGSLSPSLLIAKLKKKDIRSSGSKNLGASNAAILLGWKYGLLIGICDILKCTIIVMIARFVFPMYSYLPFAAGSACVLGHIFPFYLKFKGGKGFASFVGMILGLDWKFFIIIGVAIILITFITDYIVIATFTTIVSFPIYEAVLTMNWIPIVLILPAVLVIIYKHIPNIGRIVRKEEIGIRASFKKKHRL